MNISVKDRMKQVMFSTCIGLGLNILTGINSPVTAQPWVEDSFEDFADGILEASGNNMYVSRDGKIRSIHRFDYNDDGYIDLLFCNTHDQVDVVPANLVEVSQYGAIKTTDLSLHGSMKVVSKDLNKDGYTDIISHSNNQGIQTTRSFISIIYGGESLWPATRNTGHLPVNQIQDIAVADLNRDGWPDIVTLNGKAWSVGQPNTHILRTYWGSEKGFSGYRFQDTGIPGAAKITSGDFNGDGFDDVAVLRTDSLVTLLWSALPGNNKARQETSDVKIPTGKGVFTIVSNDMDNDQVADLLIGSEKGVYMIPSSGNSSWKEGRKISDNKASCISVEDVNSDGFKDILCCYFDQKTGPAGEQGGAGKISGKSIWILWGNKNGFIDKDITYLDAKFVSSASVGDFDGDGNKDIAVAINRNTVDFKAESFIYFGKGDKRFEPSKDKITTSGAVRVQTVREEKRNQDFAVYCNSMAGTVGELVPSYIYWGASNGFTSEKMTKVPMSSSYESTEADFNADGYTDIIITSAMHNLSEDDPLAGANIFWGGPEGIDFSMEGHTILFEYYLASSNVADLNKDGYLDLVLGSFNINNYDTKIIIYYGDTNGFTREKRVEVACPDRSHSIQLADYNKDGWIDITVTSFYKGVKLFYGSEKGFDANNRIDFELPAIIDLETADLNSDGWLDLVACSYHDNANNNIFDMGTYILWGQASGFNYSHSQFLPGFAGLGPAVADFDNDGFLDLFIPHYHGELIRDMIPAYLYWGSQDGFNVDNRTELINNSGSNAFAADFNRDGKIDVAVSNHTSKGSHNSFSKVYYNDGNRFKNPTITELPTEGPHWSQNEDMGNIYDRSWRQSYESSLFEKKKSERKAGQLSYKADIPEGTSLKFKIRAAQTPEAITEKSWSELSDAGTFDIDSRDRFIQYKACFISDNGDRYPILDQVQIDLKK
ncbi:MAG: FG-GAP repeat domain-containing protein [Mangrovibacterium sp.]